MPLGVFRAVLSDPPSQNSFRCENNCSNESFILLLADLKSDAMSQYGIVITNALGYMF